MYALIAAGAEFARMSAYAMGFHTDPEESATWWPERITCRDCDVTWNRDAGTVCWCCGREPIR
ncbi:MAG: hypothetical protein ACYDA6_00050 [Solirubrobacteraceae bacterium]